MAKLTGKLIQVTYGPWAREDRNVLKLWMEGQPGGQHFWALTDWDSPSPSEIFQYLAPHLVQIGDDQTEITISFGPDHLGAKDCITGLG